MMKQTKINITAFLLSIFVIGGLLVSCKEDKQEVSSEESIGNQELGKGNYLDLGTGEEGIRLKHFPSCEAIGAAIQLILKPGFKPSSGNEVKEIADYFSVYTCAWSKSTSIELQGAYSESIRLRGSNVGWNLNDKHEKKTKEEVLKRYDDYTEIQGPRLEALPYKDHIIVLKKNDNHGGSWQE